MSPESQKRKLILASTSPYRRQLLERLGLPFEVVPPEVDETRHPGEAPEALAVRLAREKAHAVARRYPEAIVIGSDQVAVHAGRVVGKPGTAERARRQLAGFSGQRVTFLSAIALDCLGSGFHFAATVGTEAYFRDLSENEIRRYVERDDPTDCAGGIRCEATGSALLTALESSDPTAIIGLPLIAVAEGLRSAGLQVP
jgi:septum formation protein